MNMKRKSKWNLMTTLKNILCLFLFFLVLIVYNTKIVNYNKIKAELYTSAVKYIEFKEQIYDNRMQIDTVKRLIAKHNQEEKVLNNDIPDSIDPYSPVLVIFVDKYKVNMKFLVASLQHVAGITEALIVFSHSYFDENVNNLIKSIDYARVVQIFFPYSLQVYPTEFPEYKMGHVANDMKTYNDQNNGTGAKPGAHEWTRDSVLSQGKHFWWWTMNHIFGKLSHTKNHKGIFTFLEDDVFLLQDFLYMTTQMKQISKMITDCEFISLQTPDLPNYYETKTFGADIQAWDPRKHSSMIAFDSDVWKIIAAHYYIFCNYDDYSWARTLYHISLNRHDGNRFNVISSTMPRAFKTSVSTEASGPFLEYNVVHAVHNALELQKKNRGTFFPFELEIFLDINIEYDDFDNLNRVDKSGHWNDPRDVSLCIQITGRRKKINVK